MTSIKLKYLISKEHLERCNMIVSVSCDSHERKGDGGGRATLPLRPKQCLAREVTES